ncbi:MAG: lipopolysaccharide heptosyltransferase II [Gemmatimonadaceae bacterium]|nr:lipopolysaccharide heptosyltransferase II [Gemmatimonadaceae bacterium]
MPTSLVIQTSFLGDTVLTTGLVAELARLGAVDVVATPAAADLLANNADVRECIVYDKRGADAGIGGMLRLASRLRRPRYDAAYLAQGSWRSAALAAAARIPRRVGFDTSAGRLLYTELVRYAADRHHAERLWLLGARRDASPSTPDEIRPRLFPGPAERGAVDALTAGLPRDGASLVALAPGSVWGTKRWPYYPDLAARLAPLHRLVVVGSAADAPLAAAIARAAGSDRVLDATGRLSLLGTAELLARCVAIVTNDSAPLHLASAMNVPTVALFGPTVPAFGFGPLSTRSTIVEVDGLPCRPCDPHGPEVCPLRHWKCMVNLGADRVLDATLALIRSA